MLGKFVSAALLFVGALGGIAETYTRTVSYEGHKVLKCATKGRSDIEHVYDFVHKFGLDVWVERPEEMHIRFTPEQLANVEIKANFAACSVVVPDVEQYISNWEAGLFSQKENAGWFEEYHTYNEIVPWYQSLAASYPGLATYVSSIGSSTQGRAQPALKFGYGDKTFYVQCQIHAREWISGATCQYVVNELLAGYGNGTTTDLLDELTFVFVPFVNPDGYEWTHTNDRLWRKNRETNSGSACIGVDLNRNYNSHWASGGSSSNPCSDTYHGPTAASSKETKNTVSFFKSLAPVVAAIDMHSYSQLILRPWGWTRSNSPDETFLKSVGDGMRSAILSSGGVSYTSQKSIDLYVTTGTASDWFYDDEATATNGGYRAAGFTLELRDTGRYGFLLPPDQIIPTGKEIFAAITYFAERIIASPIENK